MVIKQLKKLRIRAKERFTPFVTTYPGFTCYAVDKSSFLFMYEEIFEKEIYKFSTDKETPFIIDCGANIGLPIAYFKQKFPKAKMLAFEPDPDIFTVLEKNIASVAATEQTTCIQACLAAETGDVTFYPDNADGGTMSHCTPDTEAITVPAVTLGAYMDSEIDFLKMDIEGAEYEVLQSVANKLHFVKNIFVEYHSFAGEAQHFDDILKILKDAGFRYYIEHIGIRSEEPYLKRSVDHGMDMQINIYGYRE